MPSRVWKNKTKETNSCNQKEYEILKTVNRVGCYEDEGEFEKIIELRLPPKQTRGYKVYKLINMHTLIRTCRLEKSI